MQDFLHKVRIQELCSKQNKENAQTPLRVISNTTIFHAGWSRIRDSQLRSGRTRILAVEKTEERLECLNKYRMMLLSFPRKNCVIKNEDCRTSETRRQDTFDGFRMSHRKAIKDAPSSQLKICLQEAGIYSS